MPKPISAMNPEHRELIGEFAQWWLDDVDNAHRVTDTVRKYTLCECLYKYLGCEYGMAEHHRAQVLYTLVELLEDICGTAYHPFNTPDLPVWDERLKGICHKNAKRRQFAKILVELTEYAK